MQIGHAGEEQGQQRHARIVGGPASLFVYQKTNELFVADGYFNHRVVVFDADDGQVQACTGAPTARSRMTSYKFRRVRS